MKGNATPAVGVAAVAIVRALAGWLSVTESAVTMQSWVGSCEVTATPASIAPLVVSVTVEPATGTHAWPSLELYAVNVLLERPTARYAGTAILPNGTLRLAGTVVPLANGVLQFRVAGGTGRYAKARGTVLVGSGDKRVLNTYHLTLPSGGNVA